MSKREKIGSDMEELLWKVGRRTTSNFHKEDKIVRIYGKN